MLFVYYQGVMDVPGTFENGGYEDVGFREYIICRRRKLERRCYIAIRIRTMTDLDNN